MRKTCNSHLFFGSAAEQIGYQQRAQGYAANAQAEPRQELASVDTKSVFDDLFFHALPGFYDGQVFVMVSSRLYITSMVFIRAAAVFASGTCCCLYSPVFRVSRASSFL